PRLSHRPPRSRRQASAPGRVRHRQGRGVHAADRDRRDVRGGVAPAPHAAPAGRVSVRDGSLPGSRVHVHPRPHPRRRLRGSAPGASAHAPWAHSRDHGAHRGRAPRGAARAARGPRLQGRGVAQGGDVSPPGGGEGRVALGQPRGRGAARAGAGGAGRAARGSRDERDGHRRAARRAAVYPYLVNYHSLKGEPDAAIAYGERCLAIGEAGQDVALQALARGYIGYSYHAQGRYREAEAVLMQNVEKLEEVRDTAGGAQTTVSYASSTGWLAFALAELGEFDLAASYTDIGQRAAETDRHAYAEAIAWTLAGLAA